MRTRLLSGAEIFAFGLGVFLALILGGWSVIIVVVMVGALVGFSAEQSRQGAMRAAIVGLIAALITVAATFVHNAFITQLPKQEAVPVEAQTLPVYLAALGLGTLSAWLIAFLRAHPNDTVRRFGLLGFLAVCAIAFPFFNQATGLALVWTSAVVVALIYTLQALGLNIVAGYAGLLDLGYVAFFAIGGYTAAFLKSPQFGADFSFWIIVWVAAAAAALFGLILGAPVIPLRGDYLAIVTLGFGEIVPIVFKNLEAVKIYEPITRIVSALRGNADAGLCLVGCGDTPLNVTNGTQGINPIGRPILPISVDLNAISLHPYIFETGKYIPWYFLILLMVVLAAFFISRLRRSRTGRAWVGMREDELAATSMGVPMVKTKLAAFMIGAMFSGFAGAFYASYVSFISPDAFDFSISVIVLCMVILGGAGSIPGVILGGLLIKIVDPLLLDKLQVVIGGILQATIFQSVQSQGLQNFFESLFNPTQYKLMLFGLVLVIMMRVRPQGLIPAGIIKYKGH